MKKVIYESLPQEYKQERFLYRGFSIEKKGEEIIILDIRSTFYEPACKADLRVLFNMGFINGATYLLMESDLEKIKFFNKKAKAKSRLARKSVNPRKKQEHLNSAESYREKSKYYKSQVRRWRKQIDNAS